jgi:hypothetical protein
MTRLPQGFTNSVAIFERVLSKVLGMLKGRIVENMVDDITIKAEHRKKNETLRADGIREFIHENIQNTIQVLRALGNAGLTASVEKSAFGAERVEMLGTVIHEYGREPSQKRIDKIKNWGLPKKVRELRGFVALCNYVHVFVPCLSELCGPLTNKLKGRGINSNDVVRWTEEEKENFEKVKAAIAKVGFLCPPDYSDGASRFVLYTDAGDYAAGAVLTQENKEKKECAVRFESKMFNTCQQSYSTPKKELLAIMMALKQFRVYLQGRKFVL